MKSFDVLFSVGFCALSFLATASFLSGCDECAGLECPELQVDNGVYQSVSDELPAWASAIGEVTLTNSTLTVNYTDLDGEEAVAVWGVEPY